MTVADAIRRPEYTGANRCWPCTTLNAGLLGVAVVAVGVVSPLAAAGTAVVGTAALWLRGYLVPYTPRLAPVVADRLPVQFHGAGDDRPAADGRSLAGDDGTDPDAVLDALLAGDVLVADDEGIALTAAFAERWDGECETLAEASGSDLAAAAADAAPGDPSVTVHEIDGGEWFRVEHDRSGSEDEVYLSRPVAVAEVGAVRALADADIEMNAETRATAARALRAFLDTCPVCASALVESSTADCCGTPTADARPASRCPDCDRLLYTFPAT